MTDEIRGVNDEPVTDQPGVDQVSPGEVQRGWFTDAVVTTAGLVEIAADGTAAVANVVKGVHKVGELFAGKAEPAEVEAPQPVVETEVAQPDDGGFLPDAGDA